MPIVRPQPPSADNPRGAKPRKTVENKDFSAFASRILRAYSKRVAGGDVEGLPDLVAFSRQVDEAITDAVLGLRQFGYRWDDIANRLGVSKQAVSARWGKKHPPKPPGQVYLPTMNRPGEWS